jgi:cytochrome c biogenesis protein ResB
MFLSSIKVNNNQLIHITLFVILLTAVIDIFMMNNFVNIVQQNSVAFVDEKN